MIKVPGCDELAEFVGVVVGSVVGDQSGWDTMRGKCLFQLLD